MKLSTPDLAHLVLLGGGHAQIAVLKSLGMSRIEGLRVTLISRDRMTPYSGMLPGYIEGFYREDEASIDLVRLAGFAGARFIHDDAIGLDADQAKVFLRNHPPLSYDRLSINIGSTPQLDQVKGAALHATPIKPVPEMIQTLDEITSGKRPCHHISIIGGGVAGAEVALALDHRLNRVGKRGINITLVHSGQHITEALAKSASRQLENEMAKRNITICRQRRATAINSSSITLDDGSQIASDFTLMTTGAISPEWIASSHLAVDKDGFIAVNASLQSLSHPNIFAAGDIATILSSPRAKSGVYAVRAGPILRDNIRRSIQGKALRLWSPQQHHLALIGLGGGKAIASRGGISLPASKRLWRLKEHIDRRFISRFSDLPVMASLPEPPINADLKQQDDPVFLSMQCLGCGAKTGWSTLAGALEKAYHYAHLMRPDLGLLAKKGDIHLDAGDVLLPPSPKGKELLLVQSIDAISALVDDPYVLGRIATLHALSDLFVAHAKPLSALALLTLPRASRKQQQDDVIHLLCGILIALAEHGISLSGGHTASAQAMQVGLSVNGTRDRSLIERPPQPDDVLILTKPLGIGMIMAGHHHQHPLASGQMVKCAVDVMTQSNAVAAELANQEATYPMTDVTGFGLLRHARSLVDRFDPDLGISISSSALPLISGTVRLAKSGVFSSMVADNAAAVRVKRHDNQIISDALLHDPQTSGGLLIIVPPDQADTLLQRLITTNHQAAIIGTINKADSNMITIVD